MDNYFNYFTEIEERYLKRRGSGLLLSTIDWALIETWKDAGIPLDAVLRGIDDPLTNMSGVRPRQRRSTVWLTARRKCWALPKTCRKPRWAPRGKRLTLFPDWVRRKSSTYLIANAEKLRKIESSSQVKEIAGECAASLADLAEALKSGIRAGKTGRSGASYDDT